MASNNGKLVEPSVFLALPARPGEGITPALVAAMQNAGEGFRLIDWRSQAMSLLTTNFNELWCRALNMKPRPDLFVMAHSDVAPEAGRWLQDLIEERQRVGADILSCVIPLKDERAHTSTGVFNWKTQQLRKFSVRECLSFPKTFSIADTGYDADHCLLMNTGLWLCDFTKPWVEKMCFRIYDTIIRCTDGTFKTGAVGEDWLFSMDADRLGLRCYATNAVKINHMGMFMYPNFVPWGPEKEEHEWSTAWCVEPPTSWLSDMTGVLPNPQRPALVADRVLA